MVCYTDEALSLAMEHLHPMSSYARKRSNENRLKSRNVWDWFSLHVWHNLVPGSELLTYHRIVDSGKDESTIQGAKNHVR